MASTMRKRGRLEIAYEGRPSLLFNNDAWPFTIDWMRSVEPPGRETGLHPLIDGSMDIPLRAAHHQQLLVLSLALAAYCTHIDLLPRAGIAMRLLSISGGMSDILSPSQSSQASARLLRKSNMSRWSPTRSSTPPSAHSPSSAWPP